MPTPSNPPELQVCLNAFETLLAETKTNSSLATFRSSIQSDYTSFRQQEHPNTSYDLTSFHLTRLHDYLRRALELTKGFNQASPKTKPTRKTIAELKTLQASIHRAVAALQDDISMECVSLYMDKCVEENRKGREIREATDAMLEQARRGYNEIGEELGRLKAEVEEVKRLRGLSGR
ncbi:hypothetical protein BJY04DRAFT_219014 [Aspergillus karnatakaensis]|uniref:uncharacterized protein n=1 Tax=Aspergillus karnatakaensis TaxID=1810916 RepID=UPI003CCCCBED